MAENLAKKTDKPVCNIDTIQIIACYLIFVGLIIFPIHFRYALLQDALKLYGQLNYAFLAALGILIYARGKVYAYKITDAGTAFLWLLSLAPVLVSNYSVKTGKTVVVICNLVLPVLILLCRFTSVQFERFMKHFLIVFDCFVVLLLVIAVIEKFSGNAILSFVAETLSSKEYKSYLGYMETDVWRFYSVWGHALTNAVLFNAFFILNDIYFRSMDKRYPKIVFFMVSLLGVLLCSSKTAIAVLFVYMIISSWQNKKLIIGCGVVVVLALVFGGFDILLERIKGTSLTTGRFESILAYFQSGLCPLGFFKGYGSEFVYKEQLYDLRAGFEFPVLMSSLDYGILFTVLILAGLYIYVSYHMLRRKCIMTWLGFSLLYAQFNTFNGLSLSNQDSFTWLCLLSMLMLNCALLTEQRMEPDAKEAAGREERDSVEQQPETVGREEQDSIEQQPEADA